MNDKELMLYDAKKHEALMLGMWYNAAKDGSLQTAFHPRLQSITNFLTYCRDDATVGIAVDDKGIWFMMTAEPLFGGLSVGLWIRSDRRKTSAAVKLVKAAHDEIFQVTKHLVAMTILPENAALFVKFGYKAAGKLTGIWGEQDVFIYELDKDEWNGRRGQQQQRPHSTR